MTLPVTMDAHGTIRDNALWDDDCEEEFLKLKYALCTTPVLGFPDWEKGFTLHTDASIEGLGAVLRQDNVIAYLSRSVTPAEPDSMYANWNISPCSMRAKTYGHVYKTTGPY